MKKRSLVFLGIILIAVSIIGFNIYSGGAIVQTIESFVPTQKEIQTTKLQNQEFKPTDKKTLSEQLLDTMTAEEKKAYNSIYNAMSKRKDTVAIYQDIKTERVFELVQLVIAQHPEIFWSKGDCIFASNRILTLKYPYTFEEIEEKNYFIEKRAQEIFDKINPTGSEYEKSLAIFDYVISNTSYAHDSINDMDNHIEISTIEGVFLNSSAVCSGYSKAYQYLLSLAGIDSITVTGTAQTPDGEGDHAWVVQVIDNEYYFTDPTWGDCYENTISNHFVSHIYFLANTDNIEKTHKLSSIYDFIKSTAEKNNYFIKENLYFEEYNQPKTRNAIKNSLENEESGIELKFANDEAYQKARTVLLDNENIYLILMSIDLFSGRLETSSLSYSCNDTHNVITIFYEFKENF
ncbi:MAG: hypothetical protein K2L19_05965 [Eubacterium sp.]|nr:hypothetical protein [Eubacterium sp.]